VTKRPSPDPDPSLDRGRERPVRRGEAESRLLDAVVEVTAGRAYAELTVEAVLTAAGVSRASFYQYFSNIEDCFWSAFRLRADGLCSRLATALETAADPIAGVLDVFAREAEESPRAARLLMSEALAAGPAGLLERDALIARIERQVLARPTGRSHVDLPLGILIGAAFRFLAMSLDVPELGEDRRGSLAGWLEVFRQPSDARWSERFALRAPDASVGTAHRAKRGSTDTRRVRIARATAATVRERGLHAVTVADIAAAAGVSRRAFYNEFSNKTAAFIGAYEYAFEQALATSAPPFFGTGSWPERLWESARAFSGFLAREPDLCYLGFVESFAAGREFTARVNQTQLAFTLFLEEGYRQQGAACSGSRATGALTAVTIAEVGFHAARAAPGLATRRIMPLAVYVALAPFIGLDPAGRLVAEELAASRTAISTARAV
jgi:AcrR family transcriptional regulator